MKKVNICCPLFQKVKPTYYIDPLHIEWNISSLYFLNFWWLWLTDNENPKFSVKIWILQKIIQKIDILNRNVRLLKGMFISMHSIHGWASFCMNYCINAAWHGGDQSVALLRCNEAQVALIAAFRSSALLSLVSLIFLLTKTVDFRKHSGQTTPADDMAAQIISDWKLHTGLQETWTLSLHSSSRLWDLDFQIKCKMYFHLKRGLWTAEQQSSSSL